MLGTRWVAEGEGATVRELFSALWGMRMTHAITVGDALIARSTWPDRRTNLALTGKSLAPYDIDRVEHCEIT